MIVKPLIVISFRTHPVTVRFEDDFRFGTTTDLAIPLNIFMLVVCLLGEYSASQPCPSQTHILKTHICDKWVCGTETSQWITDPKIILFVMLYHWMRIERVQQASAQFDELNSRSGPCLGPQAVFACLLSIHIQQNGIWKEIEILVSVPQTR